MRIRKKMIQKGRKIETDRERLVIGRCKIIGVYARKEELERIQAVLERWAKEREEEMLTVGEDFNARTETEVGGKLLGWRERKEEGRRSKDRKI